VESGISSESSGKDAEFVRIFQVCQKNKVEVSLRIRLASDEAPVISVGLPLLSLSWCLLVWLFFFFSRWPFARDAKDGQKWIQTHILQTQELQQAKHSSFLQLNVLGLISVGRDQVIN
jgi:hypothetical protein